MSNTFTQLHIQYVFAVKYRAAVIASPWDESLHKYISGIFQNNNHKVLQINSMPDHIHILSGLNVTQSMSSIIQKVKSETSKWVNEKEFTTSKFSWQEGYGAFSYSHSHLPSIIRYIQNQQSHHKKESFLQEYEKMLNAFEISFNPNYIFKELV